MPRVNLKPLMEIETLSRTEIYKTLWPNGYLIGAKKKVLTKGPKFIKSK